MENAEYFINTDPGEGQGTTISPADGSFDTNSESISVSYTDSGLGLGHRHWLRLAGNLGAVRGMQLFQRFRLGVQPRALLTVVSVGSVISKAYGRTTQADMLDEVVSIRQSTFLSSDAFCVAEAGSPRKARILREGLGLSAVPIMDITGST